MTTVEARAATKALLDIATAVTTFDTQIDGFVTFAVKRLYPFAQNEVAVQTFVLVPAYGRATINLATLGTPLVGVRQLEVGQGTNWSEHSDYRVHANILTVDALESADSSAQIYGLAKYTLTTLDDYLELAVIYFAIADFFKYLLGNKRKYSVYMATAGGARTADDMRDLADYYEHLANQYLNDRATLYGA